MNGHQLKHIDMKTEELTYLRPFYTNQRYRDGEILWFKSGLRVENQEMSARKKAESGVKWGSIDNHKTRGKGHAPR